MRLAGSILATLGFIGSATIGRADVILWISDGAGDHVGQVDVTTGVVVAGSVKNTGQDLTDIGFNSTGTLYGTTFTNLYSINTGTGAATNLGAYGYGGGGMNALVGSGGTNLLAASNATDTVYSVNPSNPSTQTNFATSPAASAGDLAFGGTTLYESGVVSGGVNNGDDELINVTTGTVVGLFSVGGTHFTSLFGIADNGTTMYAVNGTDVYTVNLANGDLTLLFDYSTHENGQSLGAASGTAFIGEGTTTPEPGTLALLGSALVGLAWVGRRRSRR